MRVTMRTDIAIRALMCCAVNPGRIIRKSEIAKQCNVSENHLAQVIHQLAKIGLLETLRGRAGGVRIATWPDKISIGEVFRAVEGQLPADGCLVQDRQNCPFRYNCRMQTALKNAEQAFLAELDKVTLADIVGGNDAIQDQLVVPA